MTQISSTGRSFFLPPLAAKPRPIVVEPRAASGGYAVAMTRVAGPSLVPKQAGPKPRYAQLKTAEGKAD